MTANINTILILEATSAIGEAFAQYFYSVGKKVIASGSRIDRLMPFKLNLKSFADLDSIFVCAGRMRLGDFTSTAAVNIDLIVSEITTNLTAPLVISKVAIPHLTQLAGTNVTWIELAPPYVETELDSHFWEDNIKAALEKKETVHPPMPLKEYMDVTIAAFENGGDKEIGTGFSVMGIGAWRGAF
ncbi:hypothetical protein IFR05_007762 [Cadophora sp. M221]|nr:hypothetical protein IFR05_007762 [Cadophora sp. M221]